MKTTLHFLLFLCVFFSYAQSAIIGTVLDNNNVPIPGANVIITGTKIGAVTNFDGIFTITNQSVALPITIKVSSIGFESNSLLVTNTAQKIKLTKANIVIPKIEDDIAQAESDLRIPPGNRFEHLEGNLKGWCSIRVNKQYRLIFQWVDGVALNTYLDPHQY